MPKSASLSVLSSVWRAFLQLNPNKVKTESERAVCLAVIGPERSIQDAAELLVGQDPLEYEQAADTLLLVSTPLPQDALQLIRECDIVLLSSEIDEELVGVDPQRQFAYTTQADIRVIMEEIVKLPHLSYTQLPLARALPGFRPIVNTHIIQTISVENSIFVISTSLGNVIPNPLQPLTSVAASAGDLVVLTANQLRMLFQLAAANNRDLGYRAQSPEIASILGAAFGWRSIARDLVGRIPFGGGVVPKAAIAFGGTWAIGDGIAYYYSTGRRLSKEEVRQRFDAAYEKGRTTAEALFSSLKETYVKLTPGQTQVRQSEEPDRVEENRKSA